ncbi:MAG TPA: GDP-mannose 4,6-dehydratase, partial [Candidatus Humimicrobiaceae bacterium]
EFVSRKVTYNAVKIKLGLADSISLGNLDAKRDWGFAGDYVEAMWLMLQQEKPDNYVIATGETHTVQELVQVAFDYLNLDWKKHIKIDPKFIRPAEVELLIGDSTKAKTELGWSPKHSFEGLIKMMVDADYKLLTGK